MLSENLHRFQSEVMDQQFLASRVGVPLFNKSGSSEVIRKSETRIDDLSHAHFLPVPHDEEDFRVVRMLLSSTVRPRQTARVP